MALKAHNKHRENLLELAAWHACWGVNVWMPKGKSISPGKMLGKKDPKDNLEKQFMQFAKAQKDQVVLKDLEGNEKAVPKKKSMSSKDFKSADEMKAALLSTRKSGLNK